MPRETMTGRERWRAVLSRQKPDRVPMDIWATIETVHQLNRHFQCDTEAMFQRLHIDTPLEVAGRYVGPPLPPHEDPFHLVFRSVDYGAGTYFEAANHPLAEYETVEEIAAGYSWPSPDHWDYSHLPGLVRGREDRVVRGGGSEPMLWYKWLRGDVQAFLDLLLHPDIVHYCLGKLFGLCHESTTRLFEAIPGRVDFAYIAEDIGAQNALLYPPASIREHLWPGMKRMMDLAHQNGSYVFTHSDGAFREMIPELIEMGVDVLNPLQWRCAGMEREGLVRDFGDKLIFHGGVDNQHTLPFGSPSDVRAEVLENYRIFGEGGYILAPCHNLQPNTPLANILTLYETGYENGWR